MGHSIILLGQLLLGDGEHSKIDRHLACAVFHTNWSKRHPCQWQVRQAGLHMGMGEGGIHYVFRQTKEAKHHRVLWIFSPIWVFFVLLAFLFFFSANNPLMDTLLQGLSAVKGSSEQEELPLLETGRLISHRGISSCWTWWAMAFQTSPDFITAAPQLASFSLVVQPEQVSWAWNRSHLFLLGIATGSGWGSLLCLHPRPRLSQQRPSRWPLPNPFFNI